jgi:hypothetical protein
MEPDNNGARRRQRSTAALTTFTENNNASDIDFAAVYGGATGRSSNKQTSIDGVRTSEKTRNEKTPKIRYKSVCAYYTCYFTFVGAVSLFFLALFLMLHFVRCLVLHSDTPVFTCFIDLPLAPSPRVPNFTLRAE